MLQFICDKLAKKAKTRKTKDTIIELTDNIIHTSPTSLAVTSGILVSLQFTALTDMFKFSACPHLS